MMIPVPAGSIVAVTNGVTSAWSPANAALSRVRVDVQHHRAPFGLDWWVSGTRERDPQTVEVTAFAYDDSIALAAVTARAIIDSFSNATSIVTPFGLFLTAGLLSWSVSPVELGYRVDLVVVALTERPDGYALAFEGEQVTAGGDRVVFLGG